MSQFWEWRKKLPIKLYQGCRLQTKSLSKIRNQINHSRHECLTLVKQLIVSLFSAQPVVTTTANVIYTIPTNDPSRFSTANVSASASVHQWGKNGCFKAYYETILTFSFSRSTAVVRSGCSECCPHAHDSDTSNASGCYNIKAALVLTNTRRSKTSLTLSNKTKYLFFHKQKELFKLNRRENLILS